MNFENEINELKKSLHEVINERDSIQKLYSQSQNEKDYAETRTRKLECELFNLISASSSTDNEIEKTVAYLKTHIEDYKKRHDRSMGTQIELRQENVALKRELKLMLKHLDSNDMNDQVIASLNSEIKELQTELEEKNKNKMMNESKQESSENTKEEKCLDEIKSLKDQFNMDKIKAKEEYDELKSRYDKILEEKKIFEKKLKTSCKNLKESVRQELACLESKIRTSAEENSKLLNAMQENWKDEEGKHATEMESLKKRLEERLLTLETERKSKSNLEELVASLENDKKDAYARLKDAENDNSVLSNQKSDLESAVLSLRKENGSLQAKTAELQAKMDDALRPNVDALQKDKELHALKSTKLNNESTISKLEEILARKEAALARKEEELAEIKEALEQAQLTIMQMIEVQEKKQEEEINSELHFLTQSEQYHESQAESLSKENKMLLSLMQKIEIEDAHKFHFRSHILMLAEVASFKCDKCKIEGSGWAWQCQICDEMLHLKCNKI